MQNILLYFFLQLYFIRVQVINNNGEGPMFNLTCRTDESGKSKNSVSFQS